MIFEKNIQQNISVNQYREWMKKIGRYAELVYFFTGWFDKPNDLRVNFTELNENGVALHYTNQYEYVTRKRI